MTIYCKSDICTCDCHRVGLDGYYHCFGVVCCCRENAKYLVSDIEIVDQDSALKADRREWRIDCDLYQKCLDGEKRSVKKKKRKRT